MDVRMRVAELIDSVRFSAVGGWAPWRVIHRPVIPLSLLVMGILASVGLVMGVGWVANVADAVTIASPPAVPNPVPQPVPPTSGSAAAGGSGSAAAGGSGSSPELPDPGTYGWLSADASGPATWPCGPIAWRLVEEGAPHGAEPFVAEAFARVSQATDGSFVFARDVAVATWPSTFDRYQGITVGWTADGWEGSVAGRGGASTKEGVRSDGGVWLRTGQTYSDTLTFTPKGIGPILLHEIGHVLNLDHVPQSVDSLMVPVATGRVDFSETDRQALKYLGWAACAAN